MHEETRTREQLRHHYEVEKELADRLRRSTRTERTALFKTLYNELFARVPDHPRLVRRETAETTRRATAARMALLKPFLGGVDTFLEIAPGDCRLAYEVCRSVRQVIGVDISDQSGLDANRPANFRLAVYDGYHLDLPKESIDLAFSYQFLEHLHPEDVADHLRLVQGLLKPGGLYVISTPHRFSGPHDVSAHFTPEPTAFHLKEWTYGELVREMRAAGFRQVHTYRLGRPRRCAVWNAATLAAESILGRFPRGLRKRLSARLFQHVTVVAAN
jgi:SAM-dependent methyltransferase